MSPQVQVPRIWWPADYLWGIDYILRALTSSIKHFLVNL